MGKYRKKPVVIEAIQWQATKSSWDEICAMGCTNTIPGEMGSETFSIRTLEGYMKADKGDWIIKGVNGEFYPCKPDIFEKTYQSDESIEEQTGDKDKQIAELEEVIKNQHKLMVNAEQRGVEKGNEDKDNFAISFSVWSEFDPYAIELRNAGATAMELLKKYKNRHYINPDSLQQ